MRAHGPWRLPARGLDVGMTQTDAVAYMGLIAGVGLMVDSAELLVARRALADTGLYSWEVLRAGRRYLTTGRLAPPLGRLFAYPAVLGLPALQIFAATLLIAAPFAAPRHYLLPVVAVAALSAAAARMLFYMRQQLGLDGADQMLVIVLVSSGLGAALHDTPAGAAAVDYAALQLLLSYIVAGTAKAVSPEWRSGRAIVGITGTIGYGHPRFHERVKHWPRVARLLCWSVIAFECGATLLLLAGVPGAWTIIALGIGFHVGVTVVMGLNIFVWAFAACYPALLVLAAQIESAIGTPALVVVREIGHVLTG